MTKHTSKGETANMFAADSELVARCQGDDIAAYEELVRRHREAVYRVVYAVLGNHDQAEDVVQVAFLHLEGDALTGLLVGANSDVGGGFGH